MGNPARNLCGFRLDKQDFAVDVELVREVIENPEFTSVLLAPRGVLGLVNLRGKIITAVDVGARMGRRSSAVEDCIHIVLALNGENISLVVDEIGDVELVEGQRIGELPGGLDPELRRYISCAVDQGDSFRLVLDVQRLLDLESETTGTVDADSLQN